MERPCFLVIDREFPGSISTRKLVLETAKFNVLTAYSGTEGREVLGRFPSLSGVVLDATLEDVTCNDLVEEIKSRRPEVPVVVVGPLGNLTCPKADYQLESFQPAKLLEILRILTPEFSSMVERRNEELSRGEG